MKTNKREVNAVANMIMKGRMDRLGNYINKKAEKTFFWEKENLRSEVKRGFFK